MSLKKLDPECMMIPISQIDHQDTTYRYRLDFPEDEIQELSKSIQNLGQINPIKVQLIGQKYRVLGGWSRLYAAISINQTNIRADVYRNLTDEEAFKIANADNNLRNDLSPLERAIQINSYMLKLNKSPEETALELDLNLQYVYNLMTLLRMDPRIKSAVHLGKIKLSHAIAINKLPKEHQIPILEKAIIGGYSHRDLLKSVYYWKKVPKIKYSELQFNRFKGRFNAFRFEKTPQALGMLKHRWELIDRRLGLPEPGRCESSITMPAKKNGFKCPYESEWIIISPDTIEPAIDPPVDVEGYSTFEVLMLCDTCARRMLPFATFHSYTILPSGDITDFLSRYYPIPKETEIWSFSEG